MSLKPRTLSLKPSLLFIRLERKKNRFRPVQERIMKFLHLHRKEAPAPSPGQSAEDDAGAVDESEPESSPDLFNGNPKSPPWTARFKRSHSPSVGRQSAAPRASDNANDARSFLRHASAEANDARRFLHHASAEAVVAYQHSHLRARSQPPSARSALVARALPDDILSRVFEYVCPHALDRSYEPCERIAAEDPDDACGLCDVRDLANCVRVCRRWRGVACALLYHTIRIEAVHYCEREIYLSEARKRRSRFGRNGVPEDTAAARLRLLGRSLREVEGLGSLVRYLKMPYMLRESYQTDLARVVSFTPNLHYVDLPDGVFADDPSSAALRLEFQARCPALRKMTFSTSSAERAFIYFATAAQLPWPQLEVLELIHLSVDPSALRTVLGKLTCLRALKVSASRAFVDDIFTRTPTLPPFPALEELILTDLPSITAAGLLQYLDDPGPRSTLAVLTLTRTGVAPSALGKLLEVAPALRTLAVAGSVSAPIPIAEAGTWFASDSLETLRYEISREKAAAPYSTAVASHYAQLAGSIRAGMLPVLRAVYVCDSTFSEQIIGLAGPPPLLQKPAVQQGGRIRSQAATKVRSVHALEVFSKESDDVGWNFVKVDHTAQPLPQTNGGQTNPRGRRTMPLRSAGVRVPPDPALHKLSSIMPPLSPTHPLSSYGLGADVSGLGWKNGCARHSIVVADAMGAFHTILETTG